MSDPSNDSEPVAQGSHARFAPTQWSLVLAAGQGLSADAEQALARLCRSYWYPLYAFIRRRGYGPPEAQDLTQDFFAHLFERETLKRVDRERGRFRTFLLAALSHFLANEWDKRRTLKRGGDRQIVSWEEVKAEGRFGLEPMDATTPEHGFERQWAAALVEQVMQKLHQEYVASDKGPVYQALHPFLTGETGPATYRDVASSLQMSEGAVKVALHRLRRRFGALLRLEIAQTVSSPDMVDEEIRHLFAALA